MKLHKEEDKDLISSSDLKDGEVAIVIETSMTVYKGLVVMKKDEMLISLNSPHYWTDCPKTFKLKLLQNGTLLEIINN